MLLWRRGSSGGLLSLVKQCLARLVPGRVTQGSCSDAVIGWAQVYFREISQTIEPKVDLYGNLGRIYKHLVYNILYFISPDFILLIHICNTI